MEERNLVRKQALEIFFKRFPIIIIMMAIYLAITITLNFVINSLNKTIDNSVVQLITSLISAYAIFQLLYGINRTLLRLNNNEQITNITEFLKDAKSRFGAPLYCITKIIGVAIFYIIIVSLIGLLAITFANRALPYNAQLIHSITTFTYMVTFFVVIIKVIPYEFSFFILAEDDDKSISGKDALKKSKSLLKEHVFDYIMILLPIVIVFFILVLLIALLDRFISFSQNAILFYGITLVLEAFFTPIVRLIEINYYNLLNSGIDSDNK